MIRRPATAARIRISEAKSTCGCCRGTLKTRLHQIDVTQAAADGRYWAGKAHCRAGDACRIQAFCSGQKRVLLPECGPISAWDHATAMVQASLQRRARRCDSLHPSGPSDRRHIRTCAVVTEMGAVHHLPELAVYLGILLNFRTIFTYVFS